MQAEGPKLADKWMTPVEPPASVPESPTRHKAQSPEEGALQLALNRCAHGMVSCIYMCVCMFYTWFLKRCFELPTFAQEMDAVHAWDVVHMNGLYALLPCVN